MPWLEGWHDFFVAEVGASSALSGLLFVAISINVTRMIAYPWLPPRAAQVLIVLLDVLITSSLTLVPDQSRLTLGIELLIVNVVVLATGLFLLQKRFCDVEADRRALGRLSAGLSGFRLRASGGVYGKRR